MKTQKAKVVLEKAKKQHKDKEEFSFNTTNEYKRYHPFTNGVDSCEK